MRAPRHAKVYIGRVTPQVCRESKVGGESNAKIEMIRTLQSILPAVGTARNAVILRKTSCRFFVCVCSFFNNDTDRDNMPPALHWWYLTFTLVESTLYPVRRQVSAFARVKVKYPWRKARGMNCKINATVFAR